MKAKLYAISLIAGLGFAFSANAQCTITGTTITPAGLSVTTNMTATGATVPGYGWDWGDASSPSTTQAASHTYAAPGTYTICAVYLDITNTSCMDTSCQAVTVTSTGIADNAPVVLGVSSSPNPFGASANILVTLNRSENVEIVVYDITGKEVATVYNGQLAAGVNTITWTPENLSEGVYFMQVNAGGNIQTKKIVHTTQK